MGNQNSKVGHDQHSQLLDQLCQLTNQDYPRTYNLSFDPFPQLHSRDIPSSTTDFPISSMVDEMEETQPMRTAFDSQGVSPSGSSVQGRGTWGLQKNNQTSNKLPKKIKKINKRDPPIHKKNTKNHYSSQNPQDGESNSNETAVEQGIRDQNNCKSYHKLVKNFLIEKGLGSLIDKYEPKYHTRYYFIVALLIVKNHLPSVNFPALYQTIVEGELAIQQRKIDRKAVELATIKAKLESMAEGGALKVKEGNLENQIEHIKVVKHEIASYSVNSCRAFFEGDVEESLRILYLKNDPVMRKKYYFDEALEIVRKIQLEMRKSHSHR